MREIRTYRALALLGMALLVASVALGTKSYAQEETSAAIKKPAPRPAPEALWVMSTGSSLTPSISIFQGAQLRRPTGTVPSLGILVNRTLWVSSLTFDAAHNLWVSLCTDYNPDLVVELSASALRRLRNLGSAKFTTIIQDPEATDHHGAEYLGCPKSLQFDPSGNLWVQTDTDSAYGSSLIEYAKRDLTTSGAPAPATLILTPDLPSGALMFDHDGNLWELHRGVVQYSAAQLVAGDQSGPHLRLMQGPPNSELGDVSAFTFDARGNMWIAFDQGGPLRTGGLQMFAAADLNGEGTVSPTPIVTIDPVDYGRKLHSLRSIESPRSLAFDNKGNLWIGNPSQPRPGLGYGSMAEFSEAQLSTSGSPIPVREILSNPYNSNIGRPSFMTFGPAFR
jgi:hypothetical protein